MPSTKYIPLLLASFITLQAMGLSIKIGDALG